MKKEKFIAIILIANSTLLLNYKSAKAQIDTSSVLTLPEVIISATRTETNPADVGRSVSIITSDEIKKSGATTVAEVLSAREGIYIIGTAQNPGQLQSIYMRGANSNHVSIMIDGIRITDPSSTDNALDLSELSLIDISRIEVVRGSHSTLYGSSAIGGVINIITNKNKTPGVHATVDLTGGTFGKHTSVLSEDIALSYNFKNGFYIAGEVFNNNTKGMDATVDTTSANSYAHHHRDRDGFNKLDMIGKIGYNSDRFKFYSSYKIVNQLSDIDAGAMNDDPNYTIRINRNLFTYGANYRLNKKFGLNYSGGYTSINRIALDDSNLIDDRGTYNHNYFKGTYGGCTNTNELQLNFKSRGINLVAGGIHYNEQMTFDTYSYYGGYESKQNLDTLIMNVNTIGEFAHINLDGSLFNDKYEAYALGLGIRNSHHSIFGNNITYEINPSIKLEEKGLLYGSWSTGFNAPSLYQLYSPDKNYSSGITRGNRTLKPERSTSFEIGFKQQINKNIQYSISYFNTVVNNSIDYVYLWDNTKSIDSLSYSDYRGDTYLNIGKQTNHGFELAVSTKIGSKFFLSANTSLISGRLDYSPSNIDNGHSNRNQVQLFTNGAFVNKEVNSIGLVRRPNTTNLSLTYKINDQLSLATKVRYVGSRSDVFYNPSLGPFGALGSKGMSDYTIIDLLGSYQFKYGLSISLRAANIFNVKYYEIYGYTTRGRSVYVILRYTI